MQKIIEQINEVIRKYEITCLSAIYNSQETLDIKIDKNLYGTALEKIERIVQRAIFPIIVNDVFSTCYFQSTNVLKTIKLSI